MSELRESIDKIKAFLTSGLLEQEGAHWSKARRLLLRQSQVLVLAIRSFFDDGCMLRASALTYATLLAIVPMLALMFALLKGLGVQNVLQPIILEHLAIGSEDVINAIVLYINNTNVSRLGAVGLVFLFLTVLALLSNIEKSFNHVWGVKETRSLFRRFADYFSVVMIAPIFLLAAISMTTSLKSQALSQRVLETAVVGEAMLLLFKALPFLVMWIAFSCLYIFMPNIKVRPTAAIIGGIFGGTIWQLAQGGYVTFQVGVARYNAIYGTMAALPIFIVWLYLSWMIVLFGLEVTYAIQNLHMVRQELRTGKVNYSSRELVALTMLLLVAEQFLHGEPPRTKDDIAMELEIPPRLAQGIVSDLIRLGYLAMIEGEGKAEGGLLPARDPRHVEISEVIAAFRNDGVSFTRLRETPERAVILRLEEQLSASAQSALGGVTLHSLAEDLTGRRG